MGANARTSRNPLCPCNGAGFRKRVVEIFFLRRENGYFRRGGENISWNNNRDERIARKLGRRKSTSQRSINFHSCGSLLLLLLLLLFVAGRRRWYHSVGRHVGRVDDGRW